MGGKQQTITPDKLKQLQKPFGVTINEAYLCD